MIEKINAAPKSLRFAAATMALLTASTLGTGFILVAMDYIKSTDFVSGLVLGSGFTAGLSSIAYIGYQGAFFSPKKEIDNTPLVSHDFELKSYGIN
ncbi:MAG: hypothetical protein ACTHME_05210 [Candidatus Nitrosocosmicus sp.]